jgi:CheY-like chemotaxis protein
MGEMNGVAMRGVGGTSGTVLPLARVLLIEPDDAERHRLSGVLIDAGYAVHTAVDWMEGVRLVKEWQPAVVVLDLALPVGDAGRLDSVLGKGAGWGAPVIALGTADAHGGSAAFPVLPAAPPPGFAAALPVPVLSLDLLDLVEEYSRMWRR